MRGKSLLACLVIIVFSALNAQANSLHQTVKGIEDQLGARIGVSIYDLKNNHRWSYKGDTRFPLMSTFKTLACAKLLYDVENGNQSIDSTVVINEDSIVTWSPVTEKRIGEKISLKDSCAATLSMSDNTAANIILSSIQGPKALTQFMRSIGDEITRLDRFEPDLNQALDGDLRDTTTPNAITKSLNTLLFGDVLNQEAKDQLKKWMKSNKVADSLLRSVLPKDWSIADRSGAGGYGSRGITAIVWSDLRAPLIISIYLSQTEASFALRNKAIAEIGNEIFITYSE